MPYFRTTSNLVRKFKKASKEDTDDEETEE
jgi:hypothetical protein